MNLRIDDCLICGNNDGFRCIFLSYLHGVKCQCMTFDQINVSNDDLSFHFPNNNLEMNKYSLFDSFHNDCKNISNNSFHYAVSCDVKKTNKEQTNCQCMLHYQEKFNVYIQRSYDTKEFWTFNNDCNKKYISNTDDYDKAYNECCYTRKTQDFERRNTFTENDFQVHTSTADSRIQTNLPTIKSHLEIFEDKINEIQNSTSDSSQIEYLTNRYDIIKTNSKFNSNPNHLYPTIQSFDSTDKNTKIFTTDQNKHFFDKKIDQNKYFEVTDAFNFHIQPTTQSLIEQHSSRPAKLWITTITEQYNRNIFPHSASSYIDDPVTVDNVHSHKTEIPNFPLDNDEHSSKDILLICSFVLAIIFLFTAIGSYYLIRQLINRRRVNKIRSRNYI